MNVESPYTTEMPVATEAVHVPKLIPDVGEPGSKGFLAGNMSEMESVIIYELNKKPWFEKLTEEVLANKKSAIVVASIGTVSLLVAAAGFEFGIRHGKDIKQLLKRKNP